jgi:hypothetical protein
MSRSDAQPPSCFPNAADCGEYRQAPGAIAQALMVKNEDRSRHVSQLANDAEACEILLRLVADYEHLAEWAAGNLKR